MPIRITARREFSAQIVYAGPGVGGKTSNLVYLSEQLSGGRMVPIDTEQERTVLFDYMPMDYLVHLPVAGGQQEPWKVRFKLQTVPGQIQYRDARRMVLKNPDAVVFVADSQRNRLEANRYAMYELQQILLENGKALEDVPLVIQYNKRDLTRVAVSLDELNNVLNLGGAPWVPARVRDGVGVFRTLGVAMELVRRRIEESVQPLATVG